MFNLYQTMNRHAEGKEQKEPETTGHDRFYQERVGRSSFRKKRKPACRRAQSAAELNPSSIAAANRRAAFGSRSVSTENESEAPRIKSGYLKPDNVGSNPATITSTLVQQKPSHAHKLLLSHEDNWPGKIEEGSTCSGGGGGEKAPLVTQKIDNLAKLLFNKSIISSPSGSLRGSPVEESSSMLRDGERNIEKSAACNICMEYLGNSTRYEFISQLNDIGSRPDKHWFAVKDCSIKTERLLTLVPLSNKCPLDVSAQSRDIILELFRALHHPYIYPILDVAFYSGHALAIIPFNPKGSLKDLIYKTGWREQWHRKHECSVGSGLPLWQVGRLGRQLLEGLMFLTERGFPPYRHLHSGNVIVQNGVARITGLENTLLGMRVRPSALSESLNSRQSVGGVPEVLSLGHLLFEMSAGYELDSPVPTKGHLQLDLDKYPQVVEILELIFSPRCPSLPELVLCDLFRKIDLREMKGSCLPSFNQRLSSSCAALLCQVSRSETRQRCGGLRGGRGGLPYSAHCSPVATPPTRRRFHTTDDFDEFW